MLPYVPVMCQAPIVETSIQRRAEPSLTQGIQGQITKLSGDYIPRILTPTETPPSTNQSSGVQTQVWILSGRIPDAGSPQWSVAEAAEHPNFVRSVESNADGRYVIALAPGEYTVFAQYEDQLYLNSFQGDGSFKSVIVNPEEIVNLDLVNTSGATF